MRVAKVLIYNPDGAALVLRRSGTHPHFAYEADLPGGIIERGESYEEGLVREIREEVGLEVDPAGLTLLATRDGIGLTTKRLYTLHLHEPAAVVISWEHDRFAWVTPDDLPTALDSRDSYMRFVAATLARRS